MAPRWMASACNRPDFAGIAMTGLMGESGGHCQHHVFAIKKPPLRNRNNAHPTSYSTSANDFAISSAKALSWFWSIPRLRVLAFKPSLLAAASAAVPETSLGNAFTN